MAKKIVERRCNHCKGTIEVDLNNVNNIIQYKKLYYHKDCFVERANGFIQKNNRNSKSWEEALDNIDFYEQQTKDKLSGQYETPSNKLDDWILDHYDVFSTAKFNNFWRSIQEIESKGQYRGKKCKKTSVQTLYEAWMWAQPYLDKQAAYNRSVHKNIEGEARLNYDLTIVVKKLPEFLKQKSAMEVATAATYESIATKTKIDYSSLEVIPKSSSMDDISDLLDELF